MAMVKDIFKLFAGSSYSLSIVFSVIYYLLFAHGPTPGFWEKILMLLIGIVIIVFYSLTIFSTKKRVGIYFVKDGAQKIVLMSFFIVILTAAAQYFVLLIFFWKNPPISVGIPYSIYSFSAGRIIFSGLLYNLVFFVSTNVLIDKIKMRI